MTWSLILGYGYSFQNDNLLPDKCTVFPGKKARIVTPLPTTSAVLHPLTMHLLPYSRGVATMLSSDQICIIQIGYDWLHYFDIIGNVANFSRPFVSFKFLSGISGKHFVPRGWKYSLLFLLLLLLLLFCFLFLFLVSVHAFRAYINSAAPC